MFRSLGDIKQHYQEHKIEYAFGIGALAGAAFLIVRGRDTGMLSVPDGSDTIIIRPLSLLSNRMSNLVTVVQANRQGPPSWVVRCLETDEVFTSQRAAAMAKHISQSDLSSHLNGRLPTADGLHFERIAMAA